MTGAPEGSPKVVLCGFMVFFMEKPGIEPATPGLQGIALIHYTTGASHVLKTLLPWTIESLREAGDTGKREILYTQCD